MLIDPIATHGRARARYLAVVDLETGRRWDWGSLDKAVNRAAHWLIGQVGSGSSARVATRARNCAEMLILQYACLRAGAIFVPFNWRLADAEIAILLEDAEPAIMFSDPDFVTVGYGETLFDLAQLLSLCAGWPETTPAIDARVNSGDPFTLLYTSGTSGRPKGVMISIENAFWSATNFMLGSSVSNKSVFLCDMPLFHTAGLLAAVGVPILAGGTVLISKGFEPAKTLARIADPDLAVSHYFSVPQMAQMMWNMPGFEPRMLSGLTFYSTGGAPNPAAQIERFVRAGIPMSDGFGMTETGSNSTMPLGDPDLMLAKTGSCGLPYFGIALRIVDEAGVDVAADETGELWLRGPSVTRGYWKQPELSARAFTDGWFRTGDAARRDSDGFLFLIDRKKDMYISGGENVYPAEVEAVVLEMTSVAECAVIGVADENWGEVGKAFVIAAPGQTVTAQDVIAHCKARLAKYKVPKSAIIGAPIPRTSTGKIQKHLLKRQ